MSRIALDIMGGDLGADATISGINHYISNNEHSDVKFDLFGDGSKIKELLKKFPKIQRDIYEIHDTGTKIITGNDKPTTAVRKGRGTSMFEAISYVAGGKADAVVSSGNTGAYMALSKVLLGTLVNVDRPALVSIMPNLKGNSVMLDLGANTDCTAVKLVQFALMGQAVAKVLLKIPSPTIGLLNIGTERAKGTKSLEEAYSFLEKTKNVNFIGFIEGTDITKGTSDVIVTDGFSGNISLKTMEGTIKYIIHLLKEGFASSIITKIGYLLCSSVFRNLKETIDPRNHNGAPLVGLKKISVKSHGNSDHIGFSHAISVAVDLAKSEFIKNIENALLEVKMEEVSENKNN
jgi:glycerol-3-phosphate acyltransferase PlsX